MVVLQEFRFPIVLRRSIQAAGFKNTRNGFQIATLSVRKRGCVRGGRGAGAVGGGGGRGGRGRACMCLWAFFKTCST